MKWIYHVKRCRYGSISDRDAYIDADWQYDGCKDLHDSVARE